MMKFFKRSDSAGSEPPATPTTKQAPTKTVERRRFPRPLPLPEVVEGNGDTDWAMWEESVLQQKNQKK